MRKYDNDIEKVPGKAEVDSATAEHFELVTARHNRAQLIQAFLDKA